MIDFTKKLASKKVELIIDPIKLYDTLDRAVDKGPLRPSQIAVLSAWNDAGREKRDAIVKLHTGQGKTLVGLLMLQAQLNKGIGPAVFLCPNNFLVDQTCDQAKQFGIATCKAEPELPEEFSSGEKILVTSVQKMFNGLSKFKLNNSSLRVGTVLMDDAHACADAIRNATQMKIPRTDQAYGQIKGLFDQDLEFQGVGTHADINNEKPDAFLPVPYWAWQAREADIAAILSSALDKPSIKFAWPILKNILKYCQCVISGNSLEIEPNIAPLQVFGSYWNASHRIFMSATVTDDAFLVKGLQLSPATIADPLTYSDEKWSGEKMILLPALISEELDRTKLLGSFAPPDPQREHGLVALTPSFSATGSWEALKAKVARTETLWSDVENLRRGNYAQALVLANRYDGIDLPDDACRVLFFDGKPHSESLIDLYQESCRIDSHSTLMRTVRTVEQGMGRSVRGEKDYSVIVVLGPDITRLLRDKHSRQFLSAQMATQIEIGLEIANLAKDEIKEGKTPFDAFSSLVRQCVLRDGGWKAFYSQQMDGVRPKGANEELLTVYSMELQAENCWMTGDTAGAISSIQKLMDGNLVEPGDKGWYLQMMARFSYSTDPNESARLQSAAHKANHSMMLPRDGMVVKKITTISQSRIENIVNWVKRHQDYEQLEIALSDIFGRLAFGVHHDKFERALAELGEALGYVSERPCKEWKAGPDNLWALDDVNYIVWECKNEVALTRATINKSEAEQMNRSAAWFVKNYPGATALHIEIHPTNSVEPAAFFLQEVFIMRNSELAKFTKAVRKFFKSFAALDFNSLSIPHIQNLVNENALSTENLLGLAFVKKAVNKI